MPLPVLQLVSEGSVRRANGTRLPVHHQREAEAATEDGKSRC